LRYIFISKVTNQFTKKTEINLNRK
jgi:hypothetical protein